MKHLFMLQRAGGFESVMLSNGGPSIKTTYCMIPCPGMSRIRKSTATGSRLEAAGGWEEGVGGGCYRHSSRVTRMT